MYRKFVPNFAKISALLMELLTADQRELDACKADATRWARITTGIDFDLKAAMMPGPLCPCLRKNYNHLVRTDASNFAIGATLWQL